MKRSPSKRCSGHSLLPRWLSKDTIQIRISCTRNFVHFDISNKHFFCPNSTILNPAVSVVTFQYHSTTKANEILMIFGNKHIILRPCSVGGREWTTRVKDVDFRHKRWIEILRYEFFSPILLCYKPYISTNMCKKTTQYTLLHFKK